MRDVPHLLFASVLKPVDDIRTYHKMAQTLLSNGEFRVTIAGYASKKTPKKSDISFIPIYSGKSSYFRRILTYFKLFKLIHSHKPDVVVSNTFELIPAILAAKCVRSFKWIYDVQENHARNLQHNLTKTRFVTKPLVLLVKTLEGVAKPFISHYLLAEKCYLNELPKFRPATVLENKALTKYARIDSIDIALSKPLKFLVAGTLAEVYGTYEALLWFEHYHRNDPDSSLKIIGHFPSQGFYLNLKNRFGQHPQIQWEISLSPLPHELLMGSAKRASVWLMPYRPLPSIAPKVPSKLFEALTMKIAVLITNVPQWSRLVEQHSAGLGIDFWDCKNASRHVSRLLSMNLYPYNSKTDQLFWEGETSKILEVFSDVLKYNSQ